MKKSKKAFITILKIALFGALIPFVANILMILPSLFGVDNAWLNLIGVSALVLIESIIIKTIFKLDKDFYKLGMYTNGIILLLSTIVFTICMVIKKGNIESELITSLCMVFVPFYPTVLAQLIMGQIEAIYLTIFASYAVGFFVCAIISKGFSFKKFVIPALCIALCVGSCGYMYSNRPSVKYQGHGFDYMNGYSSTDFTDYSVYVKHSMLVTLDHEPSFVIENEKDMPVLDGAEACYPLYAAFAKAVYKDIDKIEQSYIGSEDYEYRNGKIVTFTNTLTGFDRLVDSVYDDSRVDMFFGARPSQEQIDYAKECGVEVEVTPIGKEAFVFFVEKDNPIENLTSDQVRQIYHGDITNWKELGGKNQKIMAFQRPNNSGSQTMMTYFMGDVELKEPMKYETVSAMEGVITEVAQYNNEAGAMGYTFRYFLEGLNQEKGVKMLSIDGIYPSLQTIEDGTYPATVALCLVTRKNETNPNVEKMKQFILSPDGQYIIHETGYGRLK